MRLRSAKEDLQETTLSTFSGVLSRMVYLAGLRSGNRYEHWGLTRVHGERAVQAALGEAHVETMNAILRRPMEQLYEEAGMRAEMFERRPAELLPPATDALRAAHFSLIWDALASVARHRAKRHPAA
jgi:hypothetical protein